MNGTNIKFENFVKKVTVTKRYGEEKVYLKTLLKEGEITYELYNCGNEMVVTFYLLKAISGLKTPLLHHYFCNNVCVSLSRMVSLYVQCCFNEPIQILPQYGFDIGHDVPAGLTCIFEVSCNVTLSFTRIEFKKKI